MRVRARRQLKARAVARDGTEVRLPDPAEHLLRCFDAYEFGGWFSLGDEWFLFRGQRGVGGGETCADEEDVCGLDGDILLGDDCFEGGEGYGVAGEGVVGDFVAGGPVLIVEEDAAAYYATVLYPYCSGRQGAAVSIVFSKLMWALEGQGRLTVDS